jgi:hypothetical protein
VAVEWEDIEGAAAKMFNVWTSGGDLAFAKEAWSHLAAAGLTEDYSLVARTETYLRLIAVRLIYGEFCKTKWDEDAEDEIVFLAEGLASTASHWASLRLRIWMAGGLSSKSNLIFSRRR